MFAGVGVLPFFVPQPAPAAWAGRRVEQPFYQSHWVLFIGFAQLVAGLLLLTNRFVPVALIIMAAFLYNSYAFHITVMPMSYQRPSW